MLDPLQLLLDGAPGPGIDHAALNECGLRGPEDKHQVRFSLSLVS